MLPYRRIAGFFLLLAGGLSGSELVDVRDVDFDALRSDWIQMKVELECGRNTLPDAKSERYVDDIRVRVHLAYELDGGPGRFDFYSSEVEILSMERGSDANVYFFIPGVIAERDRLAADPYFHIVEIEVGGSELPLDEDGMGRRFRGDAAAIESLRNKAVAEGEKNRHLLMPSYLVPLSSIGAQVENEPAYLRREPESR